MNTTEEMEKAVLGSILIDANNGTHNLHVAREIITTPNMFYINAHRTIWEAMLSIDESLDTATLIEKLKTCPLQEEFDWRYLTMELSRYLATASHLTHYARLVAKAYYEREISKAALTMSTIQNTETLDNLVKLVLARESITGVDLFDYSVSLLDELENIENQKQKEKTYKFNFEPLDRMVDGIKKGEVLTFGAAPNTGKSLMLLNLMNQQAQNKARCLFVGSEMTARETFSRHLSMISKVAPWKIRAGDKYLPDDISKIQNAISDNLSTLPISILDDPYPTIEKIEISIRKSKAEMVFIDYLERVNLPKAENLRLAVKAFMMRLKTLARNTNTIIFLASQLNRGTYASLEDKPPRLSDLSESSAIEKESDMIFMIWKPLPLQPSQDSTDRSPMLEVFVAKNRHGRCGDKTVLKLDTKTLRLIEPLSQNELIKME